VAVENKIEHGRRSFCLAVRALLSYLETMSMIDEDSVIRYRSAMKVPRIGSDDLVPDLGDVIETHQTITFEPYRVLHKLIFYSIIKLGKVIIGSTHSIEISRVNEIECSKKTANA
jgi:hypothetical protein